MKVKFTNSAIIFLYIIFSIIIAALFKSIYLPLFLIGIIEIGKQIKKNEFITAYTFWQLGFVFIICLDGVLQRDKIIEDTSYFIFQKTAILFYISTFIIIWYYRKNEKTQNKIKLTKVKNTLKSTFFLIIVFMYIFFLIVELPIVFEAVFNSRFALLLKDQSGGINADKSIINQLSKFFSEFCGYLLPSLILIWNSRQRGILKSLFIAFTLSIPIWFIYLGLGVRHHIVYSVFGLIATFALLYSKKIRFKPIYFAILFLGLIISNIMLEARKHGFINYVTGNRIARLEKMENHITDFTTVYMSYAVEFHQKKPLYYGKSTSAVVLFWIPRSLWPDKPTQFGYWFIREYYGPTYRGFSKKHSAPASYLAAPYSDFGYVGVLMISLFIGYLLTKIDSYFTKKEIFNDYKKLIFVSFFLASVFFLPRQLSHLVSKTVILYLILIVVFFLNEKRFIIRNKKSE